MRDMFTPGMILLQPNSKGSLLIIGHAGWEHEFVTRFNLLNKPARLVITIKTSFS